MPTHDTPRADIRTCIRKHTRRGDNCANTLRDVVLVMAGAVRILTNTTIEHRIRMCVYVYKYCFLLCYKVMRVRLVKLHPNTS